jgi:hypothetical protein
MNSVGSKTLFNPVFISIASTWAFLRVYMRICQFWFKWLTTKILPRKWFSLLVFRQDDSEIELKHCASSN